MSCNTPTNKLFWIWQNSEYYTKKTLSGECIKAHILYD